MSALDKLRETIDARREELQKVRDERAAIQAEANDAQEAALLLVELQRVEKEIDFEKSALEAQQTAIANMTVSILNSGETPLVSEPETPVNPPAEEQPVNEETPVEETPDVEETPEETPAKDEPKTTRTRKSNEK